MQTAVTDRCAERLAGFREEKLTSERLDWYDIAVNGELKRFTIAVVADAASVALSLT